MNGPITQEKSLEVLIERLIIMVGKSNERVEHLHNRILQLEYVLREEPPIKKPLIS